MRNAFSLFSEKLNYNCHYILFAEVIQMNLKDETYAKLPILETERLTLRKITIEDVEDMYEYGSNSEVSKFVSWDTHHSILDTKEFINFVLESYEKNQKALWGIEYKKNGKLIGTVDFVSWQPKHKIAEIGYVLSQKYWGKGITTEATNEIIKYGFEQMDLVRIQARCFQENIGSSRVMEKLGMSYEGTIRKGMYVKGHHWDLKLYSLLKDEYYSR
jgi:[ribosomal protein S5]-alanine N-acetyltransferase